MSSFALWACPIKSSSCGDRKPFHHSADGHAVTTCAVETAGGGLDGSEGFGGGPLRVVAMASVAAAAAADSSGVWIVSTLQLDGACISGRVYFGPRQPESRKIAGAAATAAVLGQSFTTGRRLTSSMCQGTLN